MIRQTRHQRERAVLLGEHRQALARMVRRQDDEERELRAGMSPAEKASLDQMLMNARAIRKWCRVRHS